jgi:hypothetical protein
MTGRLSTKEGIWVGVTAGAIAGVIGLLLSFVGAAGAAGIINQLNTVMPPEDQIDMSGLEGGILNIMMTSFGIIFDIIVGAIGGFIGSAIFKDKPQAQIQP